MASSTPSKRRSSSSPSWSRLTRQFWGFSAHQERKLKCAAIKDTSTAAGTDADYAKFRAKIMDIAKKHVAHAVSSHLSTTRTLYGGPRFLQIGAKNFVAPGAAVACRQFGKKFSAAFDIPQHVEAAAGHCPEAPGRGGRGRVKLPQQNPPLGCANEKCSTQPPSADHRFLIASIRILVFLDDLVLKSSASFRLTWALTTLPLEARCGPRFFFGQRSYDSGVISFPALASVLMHSSPT
ncbi:hypothetical protein C8R44DRAFT_890637 [Mycena epipterygia]|nr:hypothetical protein C8R44DRAFT_890637 [Mycena epipterygia]